MAFGLAHGVTTALTFPVGIDVCMCFLRERSKSLSPCMPLRIAECLGNRIDRRVVPKKRGREVGPGVTRELRSGALVGPALEFEGIANLKCGSGQPNPANHDGTPPSLRQPACFPASIRIRPENPPITHTLPPQRPRSRPCNTVTRADYAPSQPPPPSAGAVANFSNPRLYRIRAARAEPFLLAILSNTRNGPIP